MTTGHLFADAVLPVRDDVRAELTRVRDHVVGPGTWWTASERRAAAVQARRARAGCELCQRRKDALTPEMYPELHDADDALSAPVVDAIHRMATDPGRLTESWYDRVVQAGVTPEKFVELVGIVFSMSMLDTYARGVGSSLADLPQGPDGAPSRHAFAESSVSTAWVPTVPPELWFGRGADYVDLVAAHGGGPVANIIRAFSLVHAEHENLLSAMFQTYRHPETTLTNDQVQLVAVAVSSANDCFY